MLAIHGGVGIALEDHCALAIIDTTIELSPLRQIAALIRCTKREAK